jgi:hypothetical protein
VASFAYPDLMTWKAPSTLDCVGLIGDVPALAGLGFLEFQGSLNRSRSKDGTAWQLAKLDIGQTILCKRRAQLMQLESGTIPVKQTTQTNISQMTPGEERKDLFGAPVEVATTATANQKEKSSSIDQLTSEAIKSGFDPEVMGRQLRELLETDGPIELLVAYTAIISKAWSARRRKNGTT